jgi:hypothetical protein
MAFGYLQMVSYPNFRLKMVPSTGGAHLTTTARKLVSTPVLKQFIIITLENQFTMKFEKLGTIVLVCALCKVPI